MLDPLCQRRTDSGMSRRAALSLGAALTIAVTSLAVAAGGPAAQAATDWPFPSTQDDFDCNGPVGVFYNTSSGTLLRRDLNSPLSELSSFGTARTIGSSGWTFGRMLGGRDGRVYGINPSGLTRYRWTGTAWELVDGKSNWLISSGFTSYASASNRDKITIDEAGDFYAVDSTGKLRWHRFDETSRTWVISGKVLDTGWDKYNLIVATSPGVLYGRLPDGTLRRHHFDPATQRWMSYDRPVYQGIRKVPLNFSLFTKGLFTAGGDSLLGVQGNGDLYQYRYPVDLRTSSGVTSEPQKIGTGWSYPNVFATTNTCHQGALAGPVKPSTPTVPNASLAVLQAPPAPGATLGTVEFAYTDNLGRVIHGRQTDPDSFSSVQWNPVSGTDAYTGKPALIADHQNRVGIYAHQTNSDIRALIQSSAGSSQWNQWDNLAGAMTSEPSAVRLSDDSLALFALDSTGALAVRLQDGNTGDLLPWTDLGGSSLTGTPVVTAGPNNTATITAINSAGAVVTATYQDRALTAQFASIGGGTGFVGTPAVVVMPGPRLMVFARHTDGTIKKQYQNTDGTWPGTWTTIGTGTITAAGSPTAILDPNLGRIAVVTRTADNSIYNTWETGQGTQTWGNWTLNGTEGTYAADPTLYTYQASNGTRIAFVTRTINSTVVPFVAEANTFTPTTTPTFRPVTITQPNTN
ncbi:tachylectin-related carbohydrate-binding protein [Micromonospora sp. HK10]|uniref:tachylectin-related carbohydrate-binding protein n=1 Tax=Micromonospora sp. HK10 TaxID=1538294 RepID=UPI0006272871|nr:tachylectin-related carbohydrate-binding protein [Micromonospora sp. HK10]KKK05831.1 hypothetical protein LQ51_11610 [Micromonospora sp. HK10]